MCSKEKIRRLINFVHVAKTGTSSIRSSVLSNFKYDDNGVIQCFCSVENDWYRVIKNDLVVPIPEHVRIFFSHLPFRPLPFLRYENENVKTEVYNATFLRDPIDRTLSAFKHCIYVKPYENSLMYELYERHNKDFKKFLYQCHLNEINCNVMCKQLSGMESIDDCAYEDENIPCGEIYTPNYQSSVSYNDAELDNMLNVAKYNLQRFFSFIGIYENFDCHVDKFCDKFSLTRNKSKENKNLYPDLPDFKHEKENCLSILKEMNYYDIKLYNYAKFLVGGQHD